MTGPIDAEQFRREGYVILKDVFPHAVIDACLDEIRAAFAPVAAARGIPPAEPGLVGLSAQMAALFKADMQAYLAAAKLAQHLVTLHRMGCDPALIDVLHALGLALPVISTRPVLFMMSDATKVPGGYHKTPPHQDWRSIQGSLDSVVAWAPLADVGLSDHPLEVMPGSHRFGLLPSVEDVFGHRVDPGALPDLPFVPLCVAKGDVVVFSCLTVHRTGEAGGPSARFAASFRFNNTVEPSFVERLYPNPYIYRPDLSEPGEGVATPDLMAAVYGPS